MIVNCSWATRPSATRADSVRTATIAIHQVLLATNVGARPKHRLEGLQFCLAKALACRCHSADRAMIFDQDILFTLSAPFAHVSFAVPDRGETPDSLP